MKSTNSIKFVLRKISTNYNLRIRQIELNNYANYLFNNYNLVINFINLSFIQTPNYSLLLRRFDYFQKFLLYHFSYQFYFNPIPYSVFQNIILVKLLV